MGGKQKQAQRTKGNTKVFVCVLFAKLLISKITNKTTKRLKSNYCPPPNTRRPLRWVLGPTVAPMANRGHLVRLENLHQLPPRF